MVDRVHPLKFESPGSGGTELDEFPTGLDKNEDFVDARGSTYQNATSDDENVRIERVSGDLTFRDTAVPGGKTLSQLATGGNVVIVRDEGTGIPNGPHSVLDFVGAGVTATNKGSGVAEINIPGGGVSDFGRLLFNRDGGLMYDTTGAIVLKVAP